MPFVIARARWRDHICQVSSGSLSKFVCQARVAWRAQAERRRAGSSPEGAGAGVRSSAGAGLFC
eukprot:3786935-Lingulodinium_polyedra.AAC.1